MLGLPPRASHLQQSLHVNLHQCGSQDVCQNSYAQKVLLFFMNDMSHVEVSPVFVGLTGNLTVGQLKTSSRCDGPIEHGPMVPSRFRAGNPHGFPKDEKWWIVTSFTSDSSICFIVYS